MYNVYLIDRSQKSGKLQFINGEILHAKLNKYLNFNDIAQKQGCMLVDKKS